MNEADLFNALHGLKFDAGKSIRYHSHMRSRWTRLDHLNAITTVFFGTSVAVSTFAKWPNVMIVTGVITSLSSCSDLVLKFSEKTREYSELYKRWCDYLHDLEAIKTKDLTEEIIIEMKQARLRIERDEPDVSRVMERYSSAEEAVALGLDVDDAWKLSWFSKLWCRLTS